MAQIGKLHVEIIGADAAKQSADALVAALDHLGDGRVDGFRRRFMALHESDDLIVRESAGKTTGGATILDALKLQPTDRYRELVSAIADEIDGCSIRVVHDWPILSLASSADADRESTTGGAA